MCIKSLKHVYIFRLSKFGMNLSEKKNYVLGYELLFIYNSEKTGNSLKAQ